MMSKRKKKRKFKKTQEENQSGFNNEGRNRNLTGLQQAQVRNSLRKQAPQRPNISVDSIKTNIVGYEYELGNLFYTDFDRPDSAYFYYTDILNNYPKSSYRPKTLFVLGNYYLTKKDTAKADSLFSIIYDSYKDMNIVNAAAKVLNKPLIDLNYDPAKDYYANAEKLLLKNNYDSTLTRLNFIYKNYPESPNAPKALYTSGWILTNKLFKPDSAAVIYDTLLSKYPKSDLCKFS